MHNRRLSAVQQTAVSSRQSAVGGFLISFVCLQAITAESADLCKFDVLKYSLGFLFVFVSDKKVVCDVVEAATAKSRQTS